MKRRIWSDRLDQETGKEVSKGVWERFIEDKAVTMRILGCIDLSDKYYMLLVSECQCKHLKICMPHTDIAWPKNAATSGNLSVAESAWQYFLPQEIRRSSWHMGTSNSSCRCCLMSANL
jgi:hypothetical protein